MVMMIVEEMSGFMSANECARRAPSKNAVRWWKSGFKGNARFGWLFLSVLRCAVVFALCLPVSAAAAGKSLIREGKSEFSIYLDGSAISSEIKAAEELQKYIEESSGIKLPIINEYSESPQILVGQSSASNSLLLKKGVSVEALSPDEVVIVPVGDQLILSGARPRGTLYAVYTFLESSLGIKFWTAIERSVPQVKELSMPTEAYRYAPRIQIRTLLARSISSNPAFAAQSKLHGPMLTLPEEWGASIDLIGPWHTFNRFIPADTYLASNPEYFSLRDGKRVGGQFKGQLCLSNPDLRKRFLEVVETELRNHPKPEFISVTQNDNYEFCQCDDCSKVDQRGGGPSASMIEFVNFIADGIKDEFPNVTVQTFAYQYSRQIPKGVTPRKNVSIFFSTIEADFSKPLDDKTSSVNSKILQDMKQWGEISQGIDVWDYVVNFSRYLQPHPNLDACLRNIKSYANNKPHLVLLQGDIMNPKPVNDMAALKVWTFSKMLWNPDLDPDKLINEFVDGYYGAAAPEVREYLQIRRDAVVKDTDFIGCFIFTVPWLDHQSLFKGLKVLERGKEKVSGDPELSRRVSDLAKSFEFLLLADYDFLKGHPECPERAGVIRLAGDYLKYLDENEVINIGETETIENTKALLQRLVAGVELSEKMPPFLRKLKKGSFLIAEESAFSIYDGSKYARVVRDEKAMNGWTTEIDHEVPNWVVQIPVRPEMSEKDEYKVYAAVRLDEKASQGMYEFGAYDWTNRVQYVSSPIDADEVETDEYTYLPLGSAKFRKEGYMFVMPKINSGIKRSYLDHLVFVKE